MLRREFLLEGRLIRVTIEDHIEVITSAACVYFTTDDKNVTNRQDFFTLIIAVFLIIVSLTAER